MRVRSRIMRNSVSFIKRPLLAGATLQDVQLRQRAPFLVHAAHLRQQGSLLDRCQLLSCLLDGLARHGSRSTGLSYHRDRALQAGSVLRCGVAGQLRHPLQTGMQSISVVFHAHPTGMNISERELIWINNLKRKKICLMRTAYSEEEQDNDVQGTPYLTRNTPDKISPRMLQCSNVKGIALSSHGSQVSSGPSVFGAGGPFLPAGFS